MSTCLSPEYVVAPQGVPKPPGPPRSPWVGWVWFPFASGPPFPPPMEPQEQSPVNWEEAVEFGRVEVNMVLVVEVVVFIIIVLFGPFSSVLRLAD